MIIGTHMSACVNYTAELCYQDSNSTMSFDLHCPLDQRQLTVPLDNTSEQAAIQDLIVSFAFLKFSLSATILPQSTLPIATKLKYE